MLALSITSESLKPVTGRHTQVCEYMCGVQKTELAAGNLDRVCRKALSDDAIECVFCQRVLETLDHDHMYQYVIHLSIALYQKMIQRSRVGKKEARMVGMAREAPFAQPTNSRPAEGL